jgi:YfiH family protein
VGLIDEFIIPDWPAPENVKALQTTRSGGVSSGPYRSLNLGDHVGDAPLAVAHNRQLLAPLFPGEPVWLNQVHGTVVANAGLAECLPRADACIATRAGAVCVVMTADCLPVLLCDDRGSVVAAVHAGWRGLCYGILEQAVRSMQVPPQDLLAWLGPAIGPQAFEVGDDVRSAFIAGQPAAESAFAPTHPGKWLADIEQLARQRLGALGVTRIHGGGWCTYNDSRRFYSFRRDGITGRMGTFIWMKT